MLVEGYPRASSDPVTAGTLLQDQRILEDRNPGAVGASLIAPAFGIRGRVCLMGFHPLSPTHMARPSALFA